MIKVSLVEDDNELRQIISSVIETNSEFELVGAFPSAESFLDEIDDLFIDVAIMDINLPGMTGIDCVSILKKERPEIQFMMLTIFEDNDSVFDSLRAGATGYLLKKSSPSKMYEAIKDLYHGGSPMSPEIAKKVVLQFQQNTQATKPLETLSKRENEILNYLIKGYRYKEISDLLFVSIETVRTHIHNIYEKLQVNSRDEAISKIKSLASQQKSKYNTSVFKPEQIDEFTNQLKILFETKKPWLDYNLNLKKLSAETQIPPHALSQTINQKFQKNFFDFINSYRIQDAIKMLKNSEFENISIENIGLDCGFGTKVSFYSAFKKFTGKTPADFRKEYQTETANT